MAKYFNEKEHTADDFRITGVEVLRENNVVYRRLRETIWVKRMKAIENGEEIIVKDDCERNCLFGVLY